MDTWDERKADVCIWGVFSMARDKKWEGYLCAKISDKKTVIGNALIFTDARF